MFLPRKRKGASFLIMVVIMALVMSIFAISVTQLSRSRSATLISDATEKQVLYLAEDAANQMILQLNSGSTAPIGLTPATELGANYRYEASYVPGTKPFGKGSGTVMGTGYLMNPSHPDDPARATYSKTVYVEVLEGTNAKPLMVYIKSAEASRNVPYYRIWEAASWGIERKVPGGMYIAVSAPDIRFLTLAFDPGSDHAMLGMQDASGRIWAQEWNGAAFASDPYPVFYSGGPNATRAFDIAYENTPTDGVSRAILVCCGYSVTSGGHNPTTTWTPGYSIWNGTAWTAVAIIAPVSTTRQLSFVELATNPMKDSKEIGMIYQDSDRRVFGEVWDGTKSTSQWSAMEQSETWGRTNSQEKRAIGLAYESDGTLVFGYGDNERGNSRIWNGATLGTEVRFTDNSRTIQWLTMNSVPGTNVVVAVYVTSASVPYGLYSSTLTGTTWNDTTIPAWASFTSYSDGDLVTYQGTTYESIHGSNQNRAPTTEPHYWQAIPGWGTSTSYHEHDLVISSGTVYECIHDDPSGSQGPPNTDYWQVWSSGSRATSYLGTTVDSLDAPYFAFASSGAGKGTVVYFSDSSHLYRKLWNGGNSWTTDTGMPADARAGYPTTAASPSLLSSAFYAYRDSDHLEDNIIREWNTVSGVWPGGDPPDLSPWTGTTVAPLYERLAIAIPAASGSSGFTVVKGTWREDY
jgi:hypothetical protein